MTPARQRLLKLDEFEPLDPKRREPDAHYREDWRALSLRRGCMHNVEDFRLPPKSQVTARYAS
jgi:hypothetical protein